MSSIETPLVAAHEAFTFLVECTETFVFIPANVNYVHVPYPTIDCPVLGFVNWFP